MAYYNEVMSDTAVAPQFLNDEEADALRQDTSVTYVDAFERQLRELYIIEHPALAQDKKTALKSPEFAAYAKGHADKYVHVYFPWNRHLVKTVAEDEYLALKTNRNQDLITALEQEKLRSFRVGVLGLSVGSNVAFVLTQSGISNRIVVADFDELDTTNLNRILAGLHQVGLNKAVIAARRIYEDNPFAEVETLEDGITPQKLEQLLASKSLDCIVDEVDDMPFKIQARQLALRYKIPVVMVTDNGDGVVLHVERYDLGYNKIFGKEASYFEPLLSGEVTKERAGAFIMNDIVGGAQYVDPKMLASVKRVLSHELVSWSQLGSAAILGGVVASYAIKKIALQENIDPDIRAYITPFSATMSAHAV